MSMFKRWGRLWLVLLSVGLLAGCFSSGGDDAEDTPPPATAPVFTSQPSDAQAIAGSGAQFSASAQGTALTWAWQRSSDSGVTWVSVANASTASLTLAGVTLADNNTRYRAVASSSGLQTLSSAATLTVSAQVAPPSITVQVLPQQTTVGGTVTFAVTATGTALQYQWQSSRDGNTWTDVPSATAPTLQLTSLALDATGAQYRVVVSNSAASLNSSAVTLTVTAALAAPAFTLQPLAVSVTVPNTATFTVAASGQPTPTLQWQRSTNGGASYANLSGATASSYTTPATTLADDSALYRVVASNSEGNATSNAARLNVGTAPTPPVVTTQPLDVTVSAAQTAAWTATASGMPTPTYQWQLSTDGGTTFANINGATSSSYSVVTALADNGKRYRVVVTNSQAAVTSRVALLTVTAPASVLAGRSWAVAQSLEENATAREITKRVSAIDDAGRVIVVFRKSDGTRDRVYATRGLPNPATQAPSWSAPVPIDGSTTTNGYHLSISSAPGGNMVALWAGNAACTADSSLGVNYPRCQYFYFARYSAARDAWDAPELLTETNTDNYSYWGNKFQTWINDRGDLVFFGPSWVRSTIPTYTSVRAVFMRTAAESGFRRQIISETGSPEFEAAMMDLDAAGNLLLGAQLRRAGIADIVAYRGTVATGLGEGISLEDLSTRAILVDLKLGRYGQQAILWWHPDDDFSARYAATSANATDAFAGSKLAGVNGDSIVVTDEGEAIVHGLEGAGQRATWTTRDGWATWFSAGHIDGPFAGKRVVSRNGQVFSVDGVGMTSAHDLKINGPEISSESATNRRYVLGFPNGSVGSGKYLISVSGIGFVELLNDFVTLPTAAAPQGVLHPGPMYSVDDRNALWGAFLK